MRRTGADNDNDSGQHQTITFLLERAKRAVAVHERDRIYEAMMCADAAPLSPMWSRRSAAVANDNGDNGDAIDAIDNDDEPVDWTDQQFATVLPHRRNIANDAGVAIARK